MARFINISVLLLYLHKITSVDTYNLSSCCVLFEIVTDFISSNNKGANMHILTACSSSDFSIFSSFHCILEAIWRKCAYMRMFVSNIQDKYLMFVSNI